MPDEYLFGFNGKENDDEVFGASGTFQNYGMRMYDTRVARFISVDPLTKEYPELTPYQFASNTPIQAIDLDGEEAFFIHGTNHGPDAWSPELTNYITENLTNNVHQDATFDWDKPFSSGMPVMNRYTNNEDDRRMAATMLVDHIMNFRKENNITDEEITLIGYSHGGNVAIQASQMLYDQYGIQVNMITINTPTYNDKDDIENPANSDGINELQHFYSKGDAVAGPIAGGDKYTGTSVKGDIDNFQITPKEQGAMDSHYLENVSPEQLGKSGGGRPSKIWKGYKNPENSYLKGEQQ